MKAVNCVALFCVVWSYAAGTRPGDFNAGHDFRGVQEMPSEPCDAPAPVKRAPAPTEAIGICPIH